MALNQLWTTVLVCTLFTTATKNNNADKLKFWLHIFSSQKSHWNLIYCNNQSIFFRLLNTLFCSMIIWTQKYHLMIVFYKLNDHWTKISFNICLIPYRSINLINFNFEWEISCQCQVLKRNEKKLCSIKLNRAEGAIFWWSAFSSKRIFIETAFHQMACSSNAQLFLIFKAVSRISVALLHPKWLMI